MNDVLDARGTRCPYPIVLLGRTAARCTPGSRVVLLSDDPVSVHDVLAWCRMREAHLDDVREEDGYWRFEVVIGHSPDL